MTIHIFYHSSDLDGHCGGAIIKYKFPDAKMHAINYNQQFPLEKINQEKDTIIFVDFCLQPISEIIKLFNIFNERLILIDHHISTINDLKENNLNNKISGIRDINFSGCELAWKFFYPETETPYCVHLLGRYDIWDHQDPNTLPFQFGMRLNDTWPNEKNITMWENYFKDTFDNHDSIVSQTIEKGKVILEYQRQENEKYAKSCAFELIFQGYKAIAINKLLTNSQLFDSIWDENKYDLMIAFGIRSNGMWTMSFYTTKTNVDCSKLAKSFGGGGHAQAAGCSLKILPDDFINQIQNSSFSILKI